MIWLTVFTSTLWSLLFRKSKLALILLGFCIFYYNSQFDYLYYSENSPQEALITAYYYYYTSLYILLLSIFLIIIFRPYRPAISASNYAAQKISTAIFAVIAIFVFIHIVDPSSLVASSRPAMTDFGYLASMLLFISVFLSSVGGLKKLAAIQMVLLIFLSKLLFFLSIIYIICVSDKIRGLNLYLISIFSVALFFAWGAYQDNLNYDSGSNSINQFLDTDFFFNHVIEGATSIITQVQRDGTPDFGVSFLISGLLRVIPGSILREHDINLVPNNISDSIVISGIESSIIHFGIFAPLFFSSLISILFLIFNRSKSPSIKFISCVSIIFFIRSGSYSFINNLIVMIALLFFYKISYVIINFIGHQHSFRKI